MMTNDLLATIAFQDGGAPIQAVGVPGAPTATGTTGAAGPTPAAQGPGGMGAIFWLLPAMLLVMVLLQVTGARKEKKRRAEMMSQIKKGEKVQTAGGLIGTIIEVGETDVVLRLEEGRARVLKSSIALVAGAKAANGTVEAKPEVRATV